MTKQKILIIEDDPPLLELYSSMVMHGGYQPLKASSAAMAIEILKQHTPQLIIEDLSLPDMNGLQLIHCIRQLPRAAEVPVIILSGSPARIEAARLSQEHFVAYLNKPVSQVELLDAVKEFVL
jgi:CheY-like chemotaxis protein